MVGKSKLGEHSSDNSYGQGFCQCGCGKRTARFRNGKYASYILDHHPMAIERKGRTINNYYSEDMDATAKQVSNKIIPRPEQVNYVSTNTHALAQDERLLDKYLELIKENKKLRFCNSILVSQIEFSIRYLTELWDEPTRIRDTLVERLEKALKEFENLNK